MTLLISFILLTFTTINAQETKLESLQNIALPNNTEIIAKENQVNLILLDQGKSASYTWALYQSPSKQKDLDLIIMIRNTGAKWIDLKGITLDNFECQSSSGQKIKIWRVSKFEGIGYNDLMVAHVYVSGNKLTQKDYTFKMKPKKDAFVPVEFKTKSLVFTKSKQTANRVGDGF